MFVLLFQSTYSLFFQAGSGEGASSIDIIIRTASAAIFGYFLSTNFGRSSQSATSQESIGTATTELSDVSSGTETRGQIGFVTDSTDSPTETGQAFSSTSTTVPSMPSGRLQIITASVVGLFCLISLIIFRNFPQWVPGFPEEPAVSATVAQFRDFVSGCVGFLIGCPANHSQQTP